MQRIIQSVYALFLNNVYRVTSKISEEKREKMIFTVVTFYSCFIMFCRARNITGTFINDYRAGIMFGISIFLVCIFSVNGKLRYIKWRPVTLMLYYALFLIMFIISCFHEIGTGHRVYILESLILIPMLYYVWGNRQDYDVLYKMVAKGFCYSGLAYFVATWLFFPIDYYTSSTGAYLGATHNPNVLGAIGCGMAIAALYLFILEKDKFVPALTVIAGVNFTLLGQSRTAFLAYFCPFIILSVMICYKVFIKREINEKTRIWRILGLLILIAISIPLIEGMFSYINTALADSQGLTDKFKSGSSSGRLELWKYCLSNLHVFGNDVGTFISFNGTDFSGVHNSIIEMMYRYGIIAGLIYIALWGLFLIYCFNMIIKYKWENSLFVCLIMSSFLVFAMFELVFLPFTVGIAYMSVFAMTGLFNYKVKKSKH